MSTWERLASRRLISHDLSLDGLNRTSLLYVPRHRLRDGALPLVLVFHGGASSPEQVAKMSAMHRIAEREGFFVAYPTGTQGRAGLTWVPGGRETARATGDTRFVRKLIADLSRHYDIDPLRIFAAGISIGGSLVYELACALNNRLAGFAVVAGTMTSAPPMRTDPVPLIHIHGMKDRRVPYKGGRGAATTGIKEWLPVQICIERWREINLCAGEPEIVRLGREGVTGYRWPGAADIELWLVEDGYHFWPGGERLASPSLDGAPLPPDALPFLASERIWRFFAAHPRLPRAMPRRDAPPA